jgi:hypothetical protein
MEKRGAIEGSLNRTVIAMPVKEAETKAKVFSKSFAGTLTHLVSQFPKQYWPFFPTYMTRPFRIKAIVASNGIAIRYVRPAAKLRVVGSPVKGSLEGSIFPLVGASNMFLLENAHDVSISHMRLANQAFADSHKLTGGTNIVCPSDFGVAEVRGNVQSSFEDVQFAWRMGRRDSIIYEYLLLIFSPPAIDMINARFGSRHAESLFENFLSWRIFDPSNPKSFQLDYARFLLFASKMLEKQFAELIQRTDVEEAELQEFLCNHRTILTSKLGYQLARCKVRLTPKDIADFVLTFGSPPVKSLAVEIEPSHYEVITSTGKQSSRLNGAIDQARRYIKAIGEQKDQNSVSEVNGLVVIGRSASMDSIRREQLVRLNQSLFSERISVITFDELLDNIQLRRAELERIERDLSAGTKEE